MTKVTQWRRLFIARLLDRLDVEHILYAVKKRNWVAVPKCYAVHAFPRNVETGWWPVKEDGSPDV